MTKQQIEKFAVGFPYPTEWVEIILRKYNFDKVKVCSILCESREVVIDEVQSVAVI